MRSGRKVISEARGSQIFTGRGPNIQQATEGESNIQHTRSEQQGIKDARNIVPFWRVGDLKCAKGPVSNKAKFSETDPGGTHFLVAAGDSKVGS